MVPQQHYPDRLGELMLLLFKIQNSAQGYRHLIHHPQRQSTTAINMLIRYTDSISHANARFQTLYSHLHNFARAGRMTLPSNRPSGLGSNSSSTSKSSSSSSCRWNPNVAWPMCGLQTVGALYVWTSSPSHLSILWPHSTHTHTRHTHTNIYIYIYL